MADWRKSLGAAAVLACAVGCAGQSSSVKEPQERAQAQERPQPAQAQAKVQARAEAPRRPAPKGIPVTLSPGAEKRYVDPELGFEISRPGGGAWQMDVNDELTQDGLSIPVVLRHKDSGAQVVLQVAPAVATPSQFAERLTTGLRSHPGITTTDPEPLPMADGAVGFRFAMGERVLGRVAVMDGGNGQVFMMMATWPTGAPEAVPQNVEEIFSSLKSVPKT